MNRNLATGFLNAAERFPDCPALHVDGGELSYSELRNRAASLAATLIEQATVTDPPLTGVLAYRSATAFSGVLAALFRGHGYVPFNPTFPVDRQRDLIVRSEVSALIVDAAGRRQLANVLDGIERPLLLIMPDLDDVSEWIEKLPDQHRVLGAGDLLPADVWQPQEVDPNGIAYLLFTSGSTGVPKGVMVAHRNVTHFVDCMVDRYDVNELDRFSQMFEMMFDLSVFDMFVCWQRGACLCCASRGDLMTPARYVEDTGITIWFSVPSTGLLMKKMGMLDGGAYPSLRLALFCGEALPVELVEAFAESAPNARIENLYGPTELTIACTLYECGDQLADEAEHGVVPIGTPYPKMQVLVADENFTEVPAGESGELLMAGPQVTLGYWRDEAKTAEAFVTPPGKSEIYYRTGDLVRQVVDGPLLYLGRIDHQIKIHGHRIELGEIENALRDAAGVDQAVALGWPVTSAGAEGIVAFLGTSEADVDAVRKTVGQRLPGYMVPREIRLQTEFPLNSNGKIDRKALLRQLDAG